MTPSARVVGRAQAAFYVGTGVWPLLHRASFEAVTGRKADWWLVRTVGALVAIAGLALLADEPADAPPSAAATVLGIGSAAALAAIDIRYVAERRIRPVYLLDAALEVALVLGWLTGTARPQGLRHASRPSSRRGSA